MIFRKVENILPKHLSAKVIFLTVFILSMFVSINPSLSSKDQAYQSYLSFFEEVYQKMQENYYQDISRDDFDRFLKQFDTKIYSQLKNTGKSVDFIKWRSAAFLIDHLKSTEDVFSAFYPPKPAKEYEESALGKKIDLGIEGEGVKRGFKATHVEPRSDAYRKGLRKDDIITKIGRRKVKGLSKEKVNELLMPLENTKVRIRYIASMDDKLKTIEVISQEYFKQTVFIIPPKVPGIFGLEIRKFNRKTSEDMLRFIKFFKANGPIKGLMLDLRGNPGGPPLAAREIASFFLTPGEEFAYFQKRDQPKSSLDVPEIPEVYRYSGPMVILIDEESGSASELFSGVLQRKERAILIGSNSAGQVMLKSMFHFDDDSMVLLITARGHHTDGEVFSFSGLEPDKKVNEDNEDIIKLATQYLVYINSRTQ